MLLTGCRLLNIDHNDRVFGPMGRSAELVEAAPTDLRGAMARDHAIAIASQLTGEPADAVQSATLGRFEPVVGPPSIVWAVVSQDAATWQVVLVDAFDASIVGRMSATR